MQNNKFSSFCIDKNIKSNIRSKISKMFSKISEENIDLLLLRTKEKLQGSS